LFNLNQKKYLYCLFIQVILIIRGFLLCQREVNALKTDETLQIKIKQNASKVMCFVGLKCLKNLSVVIFVSLFYNRHKKNIMN